MASKLAIIFHRLELSASLDEKITKMEEFTSMLSLCSTESLSQEMSVSSMLEVVTQTLSAATEHQRRVGIMRLKMETLWQEVSHGQAQAEFLRMAIDGLKLSWQRIEKNFLIAARGWLLGHFCVHSPHFAPMLIGDTESTRPHTSHLKGWDSQRSIIQSSILGWNKTWDLLEEQVRPLPSGGPGISELDLGPCGAVNEGRPHWAAWR